ncbi:hypothetical protein CBL_04265 [Carabus blaptoides fortunei]
MMMMEWARPAVPVTLCSAVCNCGADIHSIPWPSGQQRAPNHGFRGSQLRSNGCPSDASYESPSSGRRPLSIAPAAVTVTAVVTPADAVTPPGYTRTSHHHLLRQHLCMSLQPPPHPSATVIDDRANL